MAKYPFEYEIYLKQQNLFKNPMKTKPTFQNEFIVDDRVVNAKLILEKNSTSKEDDFFNVQVYEIEQFDSVIPFEGTNEDLIKKEFPNFNVKFEERLSKIYLMFKDEIPIGFGV